MATIDLVGVDLGTDCFTHGQLYVLLCRLKRPEDIVVLVHSDYGLLKFTYVKNFMYGEIFQ
ncbi:hypothetical protein J6590_093082 [Homalodisca vitripennis]|nr:hypothetical protein J6590_093082 [Homalodisca vitripennis]